MMSAKVTCVGVLSREAQRPVVRQNSERRRLPIVADDQIDRRTALDVRSEILFAYCLS